MIALSRKLRSRLLLGVSIVLFILTVSWGIKDVGMNLKPSGDTEKETLSVVSFNACNFNFHGKYIDSVLAIIKPTQPDLVCLQEYRDYTITPGGERASQRFKRILDLPYHYHLTTPRPVANNYKQGVVLFSRFRILGIDTLFMLPKIANNGMLAHLECPNGDSLAVAVCHFTSFRLGGEIARKNECSVKLTRIRRSLQHNLIQHEACLKQVRNKLSQLNYPVLLAVDLNNVPHTYISSQLHSWYQDSFQEAGNGIGWTYRFHPLFGLRIDYLFTTDDVRIVSHRVIKNQASDHEAIHVKLQLP
ncbi:MAG: endonuclease/exonuclease/phosphatase family protein [Bacteroidota bacterium]